MEVIVGIIVVAVTVLGYVLYRSMLGGSSGKGGSQRSVTLNKEKKIPMKKEVNDMAQSQGEEIGSVLIAVNSYAQAGDQLPTLYEANQVLSDYIQTFHQHLFFKVSYLFDYTFETFETKFADFCEKSVGDHVVVILYGHGGIFNGIECQHTLGARLFIPTLEQSFAKKCPNQNRYLLVDICRKTERDAYDPFVYQAHTQGIFVVHSTLNFHGAHRNMWSRLLAQYLRDMDATLDKVIDSVDDKIKQRFPDIRQVSDIHSKGAKGAPNFKLMAKFANKPVNRLLTENLRQAVEKANRDMTAVQPPHNQVMADLAPSNPSNLPSAQDLPSGPEQTKTLCDNPHIQSLKRHVMNCYKILNPSESRVRVEYVQLALLEDQPYRHNEDEEEMMKLKKGGGKKLDFLESFKSCGLKSGKVRGFIDVADLLKPTSDPASRMKVVYGQAGIGKTTMLTNICRSLALDKMKSSYALVLYFPLRDKVVSSAKTLSDLLSYYASAKILSEVEQAVKDSSDKEVLFIFDGADEVPQDLLSSEERGVFQDILECCTLLQVDVIVSSRPGGLSHLMEQKVYTIRIYEIPGLPKLSIQNYIKEFLKSSPEKSERLWKELQSRDDLMGGAHIPMNLLIFCHIFGKGGLPPTLTDCYKQYIVEVHNRESPKEKWKCFDRRSKDVEQLLLSLGTLAYNGLMSTPSTFVFEEEEVKKAFKTTALDKSTFKGLLHEHLSISKVYSNNRTYNFSHATQQELFSAYYISHLPVVEKQIEFLRGNCSNPKFSMVLRFYAGLTGLVDEQVVHTVLHEPGFFDDPFLPKASTTGHSICARDDLRCSNGDPGLLNLFHLLYESQNSVLTQSVARHLDGKSIIFYLFLTSYDTRVIAHCLKESRSFSHLGFYQDPDSEHLLSCVSSILMSDSVTHIQHLTLHLNRLTRTGGSLLKKGLSRTAVEGMDLTVNRADMSAIAAVFEAPGLKTLKLDVMEDVDSVSDSDLEVAQSTARNISIKYLWMFYSPSLLLLSVVKGLAANTCVEKLNLYYIDNGGDDDCVGQALATACTTNTTLKDIELGDVSPFPLMKILCSRDVPLERLAIIWYPDSVSDSDLEVAQSTARNIRIKELKVYLIDSPPSCLPVVKGLADNTCVEKLVLGRTSTDADYGDGDGGVGQELATACTTNTTLKDIELDGVSPFPLMEVLCSRDVPLERLAITWYSLSKVPSPCTPEALETLAQDMKVKRFEIDWKLSAEDCKALADGLSRNKSLKEVDLTSWRGVPDDLRDYISAKLSTLETVKIN